MAQREYTTDAITVFWNSDRCIHSGVCLARLPAVFDLEQRPWVSVAAADTDAIAQAIDHCPSGALSYQRHDGGPEADVSGPTHVIPWPNGPLMLKGHVTVRASDGSVIAEGTRMALCRCGASGNQPFCDNSHRRIGFSDTEPSVAAERLEAESPEGVHRGPGVDQGE